MGSSMPRWRIVDLDSGVLLQPVLPVAATVALARHAENLGYQQVWVAD